MTQYDNWFVPLPSDLKFEWETEYDKMNIYLNTHYFDDQDAFVTTVSEHGQVIRLTPEMDYKISRRTHCNSLNELENMVASYRSAARRKGVPHRLAEMMQHGEPLPMPIVMKRNQRMYIVGGNTRLDVAEILGVSPNPRVIFVDLDELRLE